MHICFVQDFFPPDSQRGPSIFARTLGQALAARGHRVSAVALSRRSDLSGPERREEGGITVVRFPRSELGRGARYVSHALSLRRILRQLHREEPLDIVEAGTVYRMAALPPRFPAVKLWRMHIAHPPPTGLFRRWVFPRACRIADELCTVSAFAAEANRAVFNLGDRTIHIQPNPVDTALFQPDPTVAEEPGLIVFVGAIVENKGVGRLLDAFGHVVERLPHARLRLIGPDEIDPTTGQSHTAAFRSRVPPALRSRVTFVAEQPHAALPKIYAAAQVCVFPSDHEAWGLALVEAMAMRKAVVASAAGAGPEVVEDGRSGLLCDPFDPRAIADAIVTVLTQDALRATLGANARKHVTTHFSLDAIAAQNVAFYEGCLARRAERRG